MIRAAVALQTLGRLTKEGLSGVMVDCLSLLAEKLPDIVLELAR